jgi:fatty-acyl-CoA synthase
MTNNTPPVLNLISDHLDRQAERQPNRDFLVLNDTRLTYAETRKLVDRTARALMAAGVEKQDRVAMMCDPRPDFFIHFLAVTSIGAIWLGLNPKYTSAELDHVVSDATPSMLFGFCGQTETDENGRDKLLELTKTHPSIRRLVLYEQPVPDLAVSWETFLEEGLQVSRTSLLSRRLEIDPKDPAYIVYTSGSTGRPKGALLTHRGSNLCNVIAVERKALANRTLICNFPINHVGAIGDICGRTLTGGGTIYFQEKFSPAEVLRLMESQRLNTMVGVPTMLQMCVDHPDFAQTDLTAVDLLAWGGSAIPAELLKTLMDKTGCTRCTTGYGMTETTGGVTYSGLHDSVDLLATTIGTPDARQPLRIWHSEDRLAETGEPGEIQVKGDFTLVGYWQLPEATEAAFTQDGWFCTGDLAVQTEDGNLQIIGRMSEMFKSGGYNVYPREVELALEEHPSVAIAAVISVPDPTFQEVGVAYVTGVEGDLPDSEELRPFTARRLANYKVPKQIKVLDELPLLAIGKVDKKALRELHDAS